MLLQHYYPAIMRYHLPLKNFVFLLYAHRFLESLLREIKNTHAFADCIWIG